MVRFKRAPRDPADRTNSANKRARSRPATSAPSPAVSAGNDPPKLPETLGRRPASVVAEAVRQVRAEWEWDAPEIIHFYVFQRAGGWTEEHKGVTSDVVQALPRGPIARPWCEGYGWPTRLGWGKSAHTVQGANEMAREMCRRAQHFFNIWLSSDDDDFEYTSEDLASYPANYEFVTWTRTVDPFSLTWKRIQEIQRTFPICADVGED